MFDACPDITIYGVKQLIGSCELEVTIDFIAAAEANIAIENVCATFAQAGIFSAYAIHNNNLVESRVKYGGQLYASADSVEVLFSTSNIDFRSFQFFRNMLSKLQGKSITVNRVGVQMQGYVGDDVLELPALTELNESEAYPKKVDMPDNPLLVWEDTEFSKTRRVLIEFESVITKDQYNQLFIYTNAWYDLLEMGAFAMPVELPYGVKCYRGQVSIFDEVTYEISVDRYISSEIGFDVFVNMLGHFSENVMRVMKIEID